MNYNVYILSEAFKIDEGGISDLYILADEAKDFDAFYKVLVAEMKKNPNAKDFKEDKEFKNWAKWLYDDAKKLMKESIVNEYRAISSTNADGLIEHLKRTVTIEETIVMKITRNANNVWTYEKIEEKN
jgi:hypothetical protein